MSYETDKWPLIQAKHYKKYEGKRKVRVIVIHTMETAERSNAAENVARYFQTTTRAVSAHVCIDNDSIIQSVLDNDIAYAAPGCNHDGVHIELAGFAAQSAVGWFDQYSTAMLELAAKAVAQYCLKYGIGKKRLTDSELMAGHKGIVGHDQVSRVYRKSTHTDPGINFPWGAFMVRVDFWYWEIKNKKDLV